MTTDAPAPTIDNLDPRLQRQSFWASIPQRLQTGPLSLAPVTFGLLLLMGGFWLKAHTFFGAYNLFNLTQQVACNWGLIALGLTLVLLLGEIDLSAGSVSGLAAAVTAVLSVEHHWGVTLAFVFAILVGAAVGLLQGTLVTTLGLPSFVVTLAGLLGWNGLMLYVLGSTGNINLGASWLLNLPNDQLPHTMSYFIVAIPPVLLVVTQLLTRSRRLNAGLSARSIASIFGVQILFLAVLEALTYYLNSHGQGVSTVFVVMIVLFAIVDVVLRRTRPGRNLMAVGGNAEAARRAGINVTRVRIVVFMLCSAFAAAGGIFAMANLGAVSQSAGGGDVLINSIAACVIGGVSLFGGRGMVWGTLVGLFVIGVIQNGFAILGLTTDVQAMITGLVLVAAVVLDGLSRRGQVKR